MDLIPTPFQTVGPYFHLGCTATHSVSCVAAANAQGQPVRLVLQVFNADAVPISDAMIEIWQANAEGKYNHPDDHQQKSVDPHCRGFGRLGTDAQGLCIFETIKPGRVPGNHGALQAPHLNVSLFARGILGRFTTRIYFRDDPANSDDPVLSLVPEDRRHTLMAVNTADSSDWRFDLRLGGAGETVFFAV